MLKIYTWILAHRPHLNREGGQDLIEYAMLGGLIALALIGVIAIFGGAIVDMGNNIADCIDFDGGTVCTAGP